MTGRVGGGISSREPGKVKAGTDKTGRTWSRNLIVEQPKSDRPLGYDGVASVNNAR